MTKAIALAKASLARSESKAVDALLQRWLHAKKADTRRAYRDSLHAFAAWWSLREGHVSNDMDAVRLLLARARADGNATCVRWFDDQLSWGHAVTTIRLRYAALRSLCSLMESIGEAQWTPTVRPPMSDKRTPLEARNKMRGIPDAYMKIMSEALREASQGNRLAIRDVAIMRMGRDMGFRRIEIHMLNVTDVDFEGRQVLVSGKGRRRKQPVPLPHSMVPILRAWLAVRVPDGARANDDAMFLGRNLTRLSRIGIYKMVTRRGAELGLTLQPHDLRRIFCTRAIDRFGLRRAKALTRHAYESTLSLYDLTEGAELEAMANEVTEDTSEDDA